MTDTKERILKEAMLLFGRKGYKAVSIRDIAGKVGIRESSVYNHFKSKQAIFDTILEDSLQTMQEYFQSVQVPENSQANVSMYDGLNYDGLLAKIENTFRFYFEEESAVLLRRILLISQFDDIRCRCMYRKIFYEEPLRIQSRVFERLMERGTFKTAEPGVVAAEFFGPVFMMLSVCDSFEEMKEPLAKHLREFLNSYEVKENL